MSDMEVGAFPPSPCRARTHAGRTSRAVCVQVDKIRGSNCPAESTLQEYPDSNQSKAVCKILYLWMHRKKQITGPLARLGKVMGYKPLTKERSG